MSFHSIFLSFTLYGIYTQWHHILRFTLRQPHGEICANNVYLVNGNAKLGKALNPEWYEKTFGDDIDKFYGMVKSLFKSKGSKLSFGLDH